jgi:2-methylisocitrate lyase-like PEP mutase family enzyme
MHRHNTVIRAQLASAGSGENTGTEGVPVGSVMLVSTQQDKAERFAALHRGPAPLVVANPWDRGSARVLEAAGFQALATTSGGFAATLGRRDGQVTREEALAHARLVVDAVDVPVSADLENCFADDPDGVAETVRGAVAAGLAGCSVEDFTRDPRRPIYDLSLATARVAAAADAAHAGPAALVLTARAENYLHGRPDLADTIARLQAYQQAGADVLYAPGLTALGDIQQVVSALDRPVNVLALPAAPTVAELADVGVRRISVGSAFAWVALGGVVEAAQELLGAGTYRFFARASTGREHAQAVFDN